VSCVAASEYVPCVIVINSSYDSRTDSKNS
jgi:hypothetical protein